MFIPRSSGGWKVRVKALADRVLGGPLFPVVGGHLFAVPSHDAEKDSTLVSPLLLRTLFPTRGHPHDVI